MTSMNTSKGIRIQHRKIGEGHPCFIIAEAGVNHNGDLKLAKKLVDAAAAAGADAVKFQSFKAESLVTRTAPRAEYQKKTTGSKDSQQDMLRRLELDAEAHREIATYCQKKKIIFLSTPFDEENVELLAALGVPAIKIPSGEITNLPFLKYVACKKRPIILSTGMSSLEEVEAAVNTIREHGDSPLALLHCTSAYPARPQDANLRAIQTMKDAFALPVGYSDHTRGVVVSFAAVALGACIIEKHFTLSRDLEGPDHKASFEPAELKATIQGIRAVEQSLGDGIKRMAKCERDIARLVRRSIVARRTIRAGEILKPGMLTCKRPATGISPVHWDSVIGRKAKRAIPADSVLKWDYFG